MKAGVALGYLPGGRGVKSLRVDVLPWCDPALLGH
jgi:hypothetical protein